MRGGYEGIRPSFAGSSAGVHVRAGACAPTTARQAHHLPTPGDPMPLSRRDFTARTVIAGAGVALTGTVGALATAPGALAADDSTRPDEHARPCEPGYGPLIA